ncbi:MAG TPA: imelysin family protein [Burkholderiaceae bacterium]|nr:imelysin family protein [Burkholderiaceae bacterium]
MSKITRRSVLLGFGALPLVLAGCGGGGGGGDDGAAGPTGFAAKAVVDNVTDNIIVQTYRNLNTRAAALLAAVQALAAAPNDEAKMNLAQDAWKAARVPWESSEGFLFGPVDSLLIDPAIDSWPLDTPTLQAFLAGNPNATQAQIDNATDDVRGFHAMEYLLFGDGTTINDKPASALTTAEVNYLVALAQAFKARTQALETSWTTDFGGTGPFATTLKTPGAGRTYTNYAGVLQELLTGVTTIADEVGNAKMAEPMGATIGAADTSLVESQYSWNSLTDFHNNIQSILNVYTGKLGYNWQSDTPSTSLNGLYSFVAFSNQTLATRVLNEIIGAQKKIALIKGDGVDSTTVISGSARPFRTQISDAAGRVLIEDAIAACNTLQKSFQDNVRPLLASTTFAN